MAAGSKKTPDPELPHATAIASVNRMVAPQPYLRIGFLVHDVSRMRRTLFDQRLKELNITRAQWSALAELSRGGTSGLIQADLARQLDIGKVTIGGLLERLEVSGIIERRADASDRRTRRVFITDKGYAIIEQMQSIGRELNSTIMKGLTLDQIHLAEDVLQSMKANLRAALKNV